MSQFCDLHIAVVSSDPDGSSIYSYATRGKKESIDHILAEVREFFSHNIPEGTVSTIVFGRNALKKEQ